jgi:CHAT domain-containing protein/tetratricopeptide (TPR) repeat protein
MGGRPTRVRPIRRGIVLSAIALAGTIAGARSQPARESLTPGVTVTREFTGGVAHTYQLPLDAGQFTLVTVTPENFDALVTVLDPAGHRVIDRASGEVGVVAAAAGRYLFEVRPDFAAAAPQRYTIDASAPRTASAADRSRASADQALAEARRLATARPAAFREAIDKATLAAGLFRDADAPGAEARAWLGLFDCQSGLGETAKARAAGEEALAIAEAAGDRRREADAHLSLGTTYVSLPERPRSLEHYRAALALYEQLGERRRQARVLTNMGNAYNDLDDYPTAVEYFDRALPLASAVGDREQVARAYNGLGLARNGFGDLPAALEALSRGLPITRALDQPQLEMMILNNLGIVYRGLGDYRRALDSYTASQTIARALGSESSGVQLLNNIGSIYRAQGQVQQSVDYYNQALPIFRRLKMTVGEANALNNLGAAYAELGDAQAALDYHRQSEAIRKANGDRRGEASSLNGAGFALYKLGQLDAALAALRSALDIRRQIEDRAGEAETLLNIAAVERDRGDVGGARAKIEAALAIIESTRAGIADAGLRASYVARVEQTYGFYVDLLMQLHAGSPGAGYDRAALQSVERTHARVLLESLVEVRADLREGVDPALLQHERTLEHEIAASSSRLSRALSGGFASTAADARRELARLDGDYQRLQSEIRAASPRYASLTQPEPLTVDAIQHDVLDGGTVLLEFALGERRSWLWAVTPAALTTVELPARDTLETAARGLYEALTARQPREGEAGTAYARRVAAADQLVRIRGAAVSRLLFGGIAAQLNGAWRGKRLAIVPAGALQYLPFAALPVPAAAGAGSAPRLMAGHEIVEAPSATVLATLRREAAGRPRAGQRVAVLADPVFEAGDPRVARASAAAAGDAIPSYLTSRAVQRIDDVRGRGLARLPFTRDEANAIAAIAGPARTLRATDFDARRATVLGGGLEDYRIVHFATHGLIDAERPELSGLVLSLVDARGAPQDGLLRLHDIFNLALRADLVVLSGCQTGLGKEIRGEGLVGLTRGFMYAGAPRIVASLWQVSDLATAELMKEFYAGLLERRLTPAAALRRAQIAIAQNPRWSAPYFWAGFVLQGDWQPARPPG